MAEATKYSADVRKRAVRFVHEHAAAYSSRWAAISSIAEQIGCTHDTLRIWVRQAKRDAGLRPELSTDERQRLKELERENHEWPLEPLGYLPPAAYEAQYHERQTAPVVA